MTVPETAVANGARSASAAKAGEAAPGWRRMLVFGTGFGIAIGERDLELAVVRARPSGPVIAGVTTIRDFREKPAAEWGAEASAFLSGAGEKHLAATVVFRRDEVIVRTLHLAGVSDKDLKGAIELQIDTLHPYGDEEIVWSHMRTGRETVLIGLVRKASLDDYETLFTEAGIPMAAATFSSAVIHAALRVWNAAPASVSLAHSGELRSHGMVCFAAGDRGRIEIYGESEARPVYSAAFSVPPERALALSRAELRLAPDYPALPLEEALPAPGATRVKVSPVAYAAAVAAAPMFSRFANLLPAERRASHARRQYLLPLILGGLLTAALIAAFIVLPALERRNYLAALNNEARRLEPLALRAQTLEKQAAANRNRVAALDDFRRRPQADLEVLNELTRILPAQVWTNSIEIYPDSVVIAGEADQAAPLLKLLDASPLFQNSEFALSVTRNQQNEQFRVKTMRRNRTGRVTP